MKITVITNPANATIVVGLHRKSRTNCITRSEWSKASMCSRRMKKKTILELVEYLANIHESPIQALFYLREMELRGYSPDTTLCNPLLFEGPERVFDMGRIIDSSKAWDVIQRLNTFRGDETVLALKILFEHFVWNFNPYIGKRERKFLDIVFIPSRSGGRVGVRTARTNGKTLWINVPNTMNVAFDQKDTHFGRLPRGVSHFSAVILHEMGHVIRERANHTTFPYMVDISPDLGKCLREFEEYIYEVYEEMGRSGSRKHKKEYEDRKDQREEWIADMFAKSFIVHALKARSSRPRRKRRDAT